MEKEYFPYSTFTLVKDLYSFIKPYRTRFIVLSILRIISDVVWLYPAYALAAFVTMLSRYNPGESLREVWIIMSLFAGAFLVRLVLHYIVKMQMYAMSEKLYLEAQLKTTEHMFKLDVSWHEYENAGNKLKKITRGADSIDKIIRMWITNFLEIVVNFVGTIFVIAKFDTFISYLTIAFLIVFYVVSYYFTRNGSLASQIVNRGEEDVEGLLFEAVNNIRSVKVLAMMKSLSTLLRKESDALFFKIKERIFWFQTGNLAKFFVGQVFRLGVLAFIIFGISQGRYEVGFLILFNAYFSLIWQSVSQLSDLTQEFVVAKYAVGSMMRVLNEKVNIDKEEGKVSFPPDWKKIAFQNVSFSYGKNAVLHDVSFEINRGERVGIVGLSGAGKSTLFKLLLKEYENYEGKILVDDVSLRDIERNDYFKYAAPVLQETEVFNFSLRENITLSNSDEMNNEALLNRALEISHTSDFLHKLPNGVDTKIGEKGVKLSGGEKQRLGIARAIFKTPQILLLDEATSHLDIESEEKIQSSLHEFFQTVTAFVIAHRLTTIKEMNRIVVFEGGKILESGTFEELYKKKGRFFDLWEKQKL